MDAIRRKLVVTAAGVAAVFLPGLAPAQGA